jgi:hypothetical protein
MDFDHLDGSGKLANVGEILRLGWGLERLLDEIEKCDLVCVICHRERTHQRWLKTNKNWQISLESFRLNVPEEYVYKYGEYISWESIEELKQLQ